MNYYASDKFISVYLLIRCGYSVTFFTTSCKLSNKGSLYFQIDCGNPSSSKIWINGVLDFYRVSTRLFTSCWTDQTHFTNYSVSAGGDVYYAVDEFYKYDTLKSETPGIMKGTNVLSGCSCLTAFSIAVTNSEEAGLAFP